MARTSSLGSYRVAFMVGPVALSVLAADADFSASEQQRVSRLEALLEVQQVRLEELQARVLAVRVRDQAAARVEAMKQQIREVLSAQEFRESFLTSMLPAGYEKGFYVRSSDEKFLTKVNGRLQFRWTHYGVQSRNRYLQPRLRKNDLTGFDVQRLRLKFTGHAFSPDLSYYIQLRTGRGTGYDTVLRDAYVNYRFRDEFQFRAGMFKIAGTQQELSSSGELQFVDRSMTNTVFSFQRGVGVRFWGKLFEQRVEYFLDAMNSFSGDRNRTITNDPAELDGNPALAFRLVWHALGEKPGKDLKGEPDLEFRESPALDIAFHYGFNDDQGDLRTTRIPFPMPRRFRTGGFGLTTTNGLQINQFGLASAFKWRGFSARGEYILRILDPRRAGRRPFTPWWLLTRQGDTTLMHGAYVQAGYFVPIPGLDKKLEAVARVGGISTLANGQEGAWEYAGGLNYYIAGNNVKLQADVTKITEVPISSSVSSLANVNDRPLIFRVQLQVKF
ncbi:MAG: porin [Phycisphaerae bacterium]